MSKAISVVITPPPLALAVGGQYKPIRESIVNLNIYFAFGILNIRKRPFDCYYEIF
jgi:hypothetical protein